MRDSFRPINALLLQALTQEILRRPNTPGVRHWFVLDEFRAMQRVHELLNLGCSKDALRHPRVSCGDSFHDFDFFGREAVKLIDQRVYLNVQPLAFVTVKVLVRGALRGG